MMQVRSPLPWVKLHTRLVNHLQLRDVPIAERGVFLYLLMLGGISTERGTIFGTDVEIAKVIGSARSVVTRAIDRLSAKPFEMLGRVEGGIEILNWWNFQTPQSSDPEYHARRRAAGRPPESRQLAANDREDETRAGTDGELDRKTESETTPKTDGELPFPKVDVVRDYARQAFDHVESAVAVLDPSTMHLPVGGDHESWAANALQYLEHVPEHVAVMNVLRGLQNLPPPDG